MKEKVNYSIFVTAVNKRKLFSAYLCLLAALIFVGFDCLFVSFFDPKNCVVEGLGLVIYSLIRTITFLLIVACVIGALYYVTTMEKRLFKKLQLPFKNERYDLDTPDNVRDIILEEVEEFKDSLIAELFERKKKVEE